MLLGHASIRTTARYAQVSPVMIRRTPSPVDQLPKTSSPKLAKAKAKPPSTSSPKLAKAKAKPPSRSGRRRAG